MKFPGGPVHENASGPFLVRVTFQGMGAGEVRAAGWFRQPFCVGEMLPADLFRTRRKQKGGNIENNERMRLFVLGLPSLMEAGEGGRWE